MLRPAHVVSLLPRSGTYGWERRPVLPAGTSVPERAALCAAHVVTLLAQGGAYGLERGAGVARERETREVMFPWAIPNGAKT